jgi:hypothetical protein
MSTSPQTGDNMRKDYWHVSITLESSTKEKLRAAAVREKRSIGNYVSRLIEKDIKCQEAALEQEAR